MLPKIRAGFWAKECADGEGAVNSEKGPGEVESPEETWVGLASFGAVGVTGGTE